jgi:hypothetical protein
MNYLRQTNFIKKGGLFSTQMMGCLKFNSLAKELVRASWMLDDQSKQSHLEIEFKSLGGARLDFQSNLQQEDSLQKPRAPATVVTSITKDPQAALPP